jgi:hypothetical protein
MSEETNINAKCFTSYAAVFSFLSMRFHSCRDLASSSASTIIVLIPWASSSTITTFLFSVDAFRGFGAIFNVNIHSTTFLDPNTSKNLCQFLQRSPMSLDSENVDDNCDQRVPYNIQQIKFPFCPKLAISWRQ